MKLADGCMVPACGDCYAMIEKGKKLAEERGYYDPLRLSISQKTYQSSGEIGKKGDDSVMGEIPEVTESDGVPYIGKKLYQEKNVRKVRIQTEFEMQDCTYQGKTTVKPVGMVETGIEDPAEARWQMNKATQKWFREKYGPDSTKWITGDWIPIKLAAAGNAQPSIYPEAVSLEKTF